MDAVYEAQPAWFPARAQIAYQGYNGTRFHVWKMNTDTTGVT